ncbi:MAG: hypothetical protein PUA84_02960 [Oscillospiraceae bacterium]|nr:hypothetical protein [Oscillospiraceae bacterium]
MANFKRIAAAAASIAMLGSLAACGSNTAYAFTIDGEKVNAGIYIYYSYVSYNEAINTLTEQNSELDTTDDKLVKEQQIDGKDTLTWIQDKAATYCKEHVAVNKEFDAAGLTLSADTMTEIDTAMETFWSENQKGFEKNGVSESSVREVLEYTYKASELFKYYYNIDGKEGTTEDEVYDYYVDNTARVQYIRFDAVDGAGEKLEGSGETQFKKMVDDYLSAVEKLSDEKKIEDKMNTIKEEYSAYVTSVSEEAAAEAAATATDENGSTITTTTTTTIATTTSEGETTTTTTTAPYANESIVAKVTTKEDTKEEDLNYTPCKAVYDFVFEEAKTNKPEVIYDEENNAYYLVVRYDIENRMTDDDLWTDDQKEGVVAAMFSDAFQDKLDTWVAALDVKTNDAAIKRYNPFDINFDEETTA